jgi:hypothetical protein
VDFANAMKDVFTLGMLKHKKPKPVPTIATLCDRGWRI